MGNLPNTQAPIATPEGNITPAWLRVLQQLIPSKAVVQFPDGLPDPPGWFSIGVAGIAGYHYIRKL